MDFTEMYGAKTISSINWNDFFSKNWISITKKIKNGKGITVSNKVARLTGIKLLLDSYEAFKRGRHIFSIIENFLLFVTQSFYKEITTLYNAKFTCILLRAVARVYIQEWQSPPIAIDWNFRSSKYTYTQMIRCDRSMYR